MTQELQPIRRVPRRGAVYGLAVGVATWLIVTGFLVMLGGGVGEVEVAVAFFVSMFAGVFAASRPDPGRRT